jgi:hypothetical protein
VFTEKAGTFVPKVITEEIRFKILFEDRGQLNKIPLALSNQQSHKSK